MRLSSVAMRTIVNSIHSLTRAITWIGYATLAGAVLVTITNVIGRYVIRKPLLGEVDIVEMCMAVFGGVAVFLTTKNRHHVSVDVLVVRFSTHTQAVLGRFASLLGSITWGVLGYLVILEGFEFIENGGRTDVLKIPHAPFAFILGIGLCFACITMLKQALYPGVSDKKEEGLGS